VGVNVVLSAGAGHRCHGLHEHRDSRLSASQNISCFSCIFTTIKVRNAFQFAAQREGFAFTLILILGSLPSGFASCASGEILGDSEEEVILGNTEKGRLDCHIVGNEHNLAAVSELNFLHVGAHRASLNCTCDLFSLSECLLDRSLFFFK
jgi:hypothetical protein